MSDELIKSLNQRIGDLEKQLSKSTEWVTKVEVARKEAKREAAALKADLEAARQETQAARAELDDILEKAAAEFEATDAEIAEWKAKAEAPPDERITQLEKEIRTRDLKAKFRDIEPLLADGFDLETAWKTQNFDPAKVEDLEKFDANEVVKEWRTSRPGLFKPEGTGETPAQGQTRIKPPLTVASETPGRGGRDSTTGRVTYKPSDLAQPGWYVKNPGLHEALQNGTAVPIDE